MARAAQSSAASSTIAQPVGSQTRASILTRALQGVARVFFTAKDLEVPDRLYQVIHQLQSNLLLALRPLAENPTLGGNLLKGIVFTGGQTLYLAHGLGRAYRGWYVVRAQGAAASLVEAALPAGTTSDRIIGLTSANAGTYDVMVF